MSDKRQRQFDFENLPPQTRSTRKALLEVLQIPRFVNHDGRKVSKPTLGTMKSLLMKIESHHGTGGPPRLKIETIAKGTNFDEKAIQRAIRSCKHIGLLTVETSKSKNESDASTYHIQWCEVYQMLFDNPETEPIISRKLNCPQSKKLASSQDNFSGSQDNFSGSQDNFSGSQDNFSKNVSVDTSLTRARSETDSNLIETTSNRGNDWSKVEEMLKSHGIDKSIEAADVARRNGMNLETAMSIIQHVDRLSKTHKLGPGALVYRLKQKDLSLPVDRGWPVKPEPGATSPRISFQVMSPDEAKLLVELEKKYLPAVVGGYANLDVAVVVGRVGLSHDQRLRFWQQFQNYKAATWSRLESSPRIRLQMLRWLDEETAIPATLRKGAIR